MSDATRRPCPHCGKPVSYREATPLDEDGYSTGPSECPHCGHKIVSGTPFSIVPGKGVELGEWSWEKPARYDPEGVT